jgi:putative SOS response-associated peptidase YedK
MCGRFVLVSPFTLIAEEFRIRDGNGGLKPRYNIAPGQDILAVLSEEGTRRLSRFRWGLIPSWADDPAIGNRMINARAETVAQKPSFRSAFDRRRCLIVADGFYEWRREGKRKSPVYVRMKSKKPFGFAGLFETWHSPEGPEIRSCTIITTEANDLLRPVHDRMPVIMPKEDEDAWLDPAFHDKDRLLALLRPYPAGKMRAHDVSPRVNTPTNDSPDNIKPL